MSFRQRIRHIKRYREIARVVMKYGLGYLVQRLGLEKIIPVPLEACQAEPDYCLAGRLRSALTELGPTFVKLGQVMSTRPDLLPPAMVEELEQLQDKVEPFPYEQVVEQLVREIGHPEEIFAEFDPSPLAAASIGQVHRATLKTGEKVIVKIQRPGIEAQVENDLEILISLAGAAEERSSIAKQVGLLGMMEEYARLFRRELDYDRESKNTERMRQNFAGDERVIIPRVIWEFTTPRVLTEEYIEGFKFSNIAEVEKRGWDRKKLSTLGTEAFLTQIVEHGFFQVDPHPGNMLIVDQDHIAFIDFGEVALLTGKRLEHMAELFTAVGARDLDGVLAALHDMGIVTENVNADDLQEDLTDLMERVLLGNIGNLDIRQLHKEVLDLAFRYQLKMPYYLTSLMKALITVEGVGRKLDPTFNFTEVAKVLAKRLFKERIKPKNLYQALRRGYYRDLRPLRSFPRNFNNLVRTTGEGRLTLQMQLGFNPEAQGRVNQWVNRLSASLLIAGGLVGSALVFRAAGDHPLIHYGYAVFGIVVFGFSVIGMLSLISSLKSK